MELGSIFSILNPTTWSTANTVITSIAGGSILTKLSDKFIIKPYIEKKHPEKLCLSLEKNINTACAWILRKSVDFNCFLEDYKAKFPDSGKIIENQIIESMKRIQILVSDTTSQVIKNIQK